MIFSSLILGIRRQGSSNITKVFSRVQRQIWDSSRERWSLLSPGTGVETPPVSEWVGSTESAGPGSVQDRLPVACVVVPGTLYLSCFNIVSLEALSI